MKDKRFCLKRVIGHWKFSNETDVSAAPEFLYAMQVFAGGVQSITHSFGLLPLSITKCWLWKVVWMWRKALMEKKKMLQYCVGSSLLQWWQRGLAQVRVFLHCIWLSRITNTKQLYTNANRAGAKLTGVTQRQWKNKTDDHSEKLNRSQFSHKKRHSRCICFTGVFTFQLNPMFYGKETVEINDKQILEIFVLAINSKQWHFCVLALRKASTSNRSSTTWNPWSAIWVGKVLTL